MYNIIYITPCGKQHTITVNSLTAAILEHNMAVKAGHEVLTEKPH